MLKSLAALDDQIDEIAEIVQAFYEIDELGVPSTSTEVVHYLDATTLSLSMGRKMLLSSVVSRSTRIPSLQPKSS